jgi:plasmid stabilization system protein ParE
MAQLIYTVNFYDDLTRLTDFLLERHPEDATGLGGLILEALQVLRKHPESGRKLASGLREFIVSRGKSGYLALYRYNPITDDVLLLRIRHQRESGYRKIE